ncbi:MAG: DinB family protein [Fimbriimonadaceae bacterium]
MIGTMTQEKRDCLVEHCKESAVSGMEQFLHVFSFVPEDRLHWTPTPTSKTPMQVATHTAVTAGNFAKMIRERQLPTGDEIPAMIARLVAEESLLTTPAEMEKEFRANTEKVLAALDTLTPDAIELVFDTSVGWLMPMKRLMFLPGVHAVAHTYQIDYLQTCWGDQVIH